MAKFTTTKQFEVIYNRYQDQLTHAEIFTVDTDGSPSDWYPRLFSRLNAFVIRNDYKSGHYITKLKCFDHDKKCYQGASETRIQNCGQYFEYIRHENDSKGHWLSQHPDHAQCCRGSLSHSVENVCKDIIAGRCCEVPLRKGLNDVVLGNLYPDHVQNLNSFIQGSNIPQRKEVIKTIEDCSNAFNWIQQQINCKYLNVPDCWIEWSNDIQNRLACARTWVEHSTPQTI